MLVAAWIQEWRHTLIVHLGEAIWVTILTNRADWSGECVDLSVGNGRQPLIRTSDRCTCDG